MNENIFDDNWKVWIWSNIGRGCDKDGVFKILIDKGFEYEVIKQELNYEPSIALDQIENPLIDESGRNRRFFVPNSNKVNTDHADIYTIDDFLNKEECQHIIELMQHDLRPSTVTNETQPDKYFRTSKTFDFQNCDDLLAAEIDIRISRMLGINPSFSEEIQGQLYGVGEEFKAHTDWFTPGTDEFQTHAGKRGQRSWTFMIYLNDVEEGGETEFVEIGKSITPKTGKAVFWNNLHPDGQPNQETMHHALPVIKGTKAVITKWFRLNGIGEMDIKTNAELVPNFTTRGFKKSQMPESIYKEIKSFLDDNKSMAEEEQQSLDFLLNESIHPTVMIELPAELKQKTADALQEIVEEWGGVEIVVTSVYGIRCYHEGTSLRAHRDTTDTHILSAIINLDQDVEEEWPLEIEDNAYRTHQVYLRPGEMLLYESARLLHGRKTPLNGKFYCNLFVHFKPVSDEWRTPGA